MATTFLVLILLAVWIPLLWFSIKAKPLGNKPYRWGTYIGITTGLATLSFGLIAFPKVLNGNISGLLLVLLFTSLGGLCCWGILRRRRIGVILFVICYGLLILSPPYFASVDNLPERTGIALPLLLYTLVTFIYFKRRWNLMDRPLDNSAPNPENITKPQD